jgi:hypothetical protein
MLLLMMLLLLVAAIVASFFSSVLLNNAVVPQLRLLLSRSRHWRIDEATAGRGDWWCRCMTPIEMAEAQRQDVVRPNEKVCDSIVPPWSNHVSILDTDRIARMLDWHFMVSSFRQLLLWCQSFCSILAKVLKIRPTSTIVSASSETDPHSDRRIFPHGPPIGRTTDFVSMVCVIADDIALG